MSRFLKFLSPKKWEWIIKKNWKGSAKKVSAPILILKLDFGFGWTLILVNSYTSRDSSSQDLYTMILVNTVSTCVQYWASNYFFTIYRWYKCYKEWSWNLHEVVKAIPVSRDTKLFPILVIGFSGLFNILGWYGRFQWQVMSKNFTFFIFYIFRIVIINQPKKKWKKNS